MFFHKCRGVAHFEDHSKRLLRLSVVHDCRTQVLEHVVQGWLVQVPKVVLCFLRGINYHPMTIWDLIFDHVFESRQLHRVRLKESKEIFHTRTRASASLRISISEGVIRIGSSVIRSPRFQSNWIQNPYVNSRGAAEQRGIVE